MISAVSLPENYMEQSTSSADFVPETISSQTSAISLAPNASDAEIEAAFGIPTDEKVNDAQLKFDNPMTWDPKLESKFMRLAQSHALGELSLVGQIEFEKLTIQRRQLKNPRSGEEIIAEYRQRTLTRELVKALNQYVGFHKSSNNTRRTA